MSKFTSLFIKEDEQVQPYNDVKQEVTAAPNRNFVQQPVTQSVDNGTPAQKSVDVPSTVTASGSISVDEKIVNMIWDKIIAANRPGPDYLEQHANKYAKSSVLSGVQLQHVSIARCLASGSKVFFLDEASGALDIKMKREVQDLILKICHNSGLETTIINITHSIEEALYISDKIIVLKPNPCAIVKEMDINYGTQPRGRWIFDTDVYHRYSKELSDCLDEVCK